MKNLLIVLSGPSGVGKGTVLKKLLSSSDGYALSVSCTTRKMREGEVDGKSYFFISKEQFLKTVEENGFLEYSNHFENYYGTPRKFVEKQLETHDVILEIDVNGALQVKKSYPEAILIMLLPPSQEALRNRLKGRATESEDEIDRRIKRAEYELSKQELYDYSVVNDDLEACVKRLNNLIKELKGVNI
ncbi:MAG: guanylate kinase [Clostridia bacterium]|nr:guanylate kinase [Clostridia bacterium]